MGKIMITVRTVDGGMQDWLEDLQFLSRLRTLQSEGLEGKELIHALVSDDWGAPPRSVRIHGQDASGQSFSVEIPYR